MNARLAELVRHRQTLISRSAMQREQLAQNYRDLQQSVGFVKGVVRVVQTLKLRPAALMGLSAVLLSSRWSLFERMSRPLRMGLRILRLLLAWRSKRRA